ncbi:MAG: M23 family metallopeptidase [Bacteroidales bacterium]|nr:M23 family metallopeptidase [Bacteroidales bacterium]
MTAKQKNKKKWYQKLRTTYRLVFLNETTFEERFTFRLTRMHVITSLLSLGVIFIVLTYFLIAYTPLKLYIPGYPDGNQQKQLYQMNQTIDSLLQDVKMKNIYFTDLKRIIEDKNLPSNKLKPALKPARHYDTITDRKSKQDSSLRAEFENKARFNLFFPETENNNLFANNTLIQSQNFFKPMNGIITSNFSPLEKHYGIDIVAAHNEAIKSVLNGTVIEAAWTLETGYVIIVQHSGNLISIYKHCATLLKQEGDVVKAGEPIAIAGNSGENSSGPHLHFELWYNGNPVNPTSYINFN